METIKKIMKEGNYLSNDCVIDLMSPSYTQMIIKYLSKQLDYYDFSYSKEWKNDNLIYRLRINTMGSRNMLDLYRFIDKIEDLMEKEIERN